MSLSTTPVVTMKGNPIVLEGPGLSLNGPVPDCTLTAVDLSAVKLSSFRGRICLISTVPSVDTPVCDRQCRRVQTWVSDLGPAAAVVTISMDLPFAQKRWQAAAGAEKITFLSDHREAAFGRGFGVLVKDLRLLARAIFIVDASGSLAYRQIVPEITHEPDYDEAVQALKTLKG